MVETYIYTNYALAVTGLNRTFRDYIVTGVPVILISLVSSAYGNLNSHNKEIQIKPQSFSFVDVKLGN